MGSTENTPATTEFVRESERISGVEPPTDQASWTPSIKRHVEIAKIVSTKGGNVISVNLINTALTGNKTDWLRTGTAGAMKNDIPDGSKIPGLIKRLDLKIRCGVSALIEQNAGDTERDAFAWHMHDLLICIHAFKAGNGRTARLLMNHLRIQLDLPWFVIKYRKSGDYYKKLQTYKRRKFKKELASLRRIRIPKT